MKIVIANHKMSLNKPDVDDYIKELKKVDCSNLIVCPSSLYLSDFKGFQVGAQNVCSFDSKDCTGEISAWQLNHMGIEYCLVGHSERRKLFNETNDDILNKIKLLLKFKVKPIICIGETEEEKNRQKTLMVLEKQISKIFNSLSLSDIKKITIAYEPIWAIGTGKVCDIDTVELITRFIKNLVHDYYETAVDVVYGGSIDERNIDKLVSIEILDGFLVGKSSLDPQKLIRIMEKSR